VAKAAAKVDAAVVATFKLPAQASKTISNRAAASARFFYARMRPGGASARREYFPERHGASRRWNRVTSSPFSSTGESPGQGRCEDAFGEGNRSQAGLEFASTGG
jgi:hypothetical protein